MDALCGPDLRGKFTRCISFTSFRGGKVPDKSLNVLAFVFMPWPLHACVAFHCAVRSTKTTDAGPTLHIREEAATTETPAKFTALLCNCSGSFSLTSFAINTQCRKSRTAEAMLQASGW